MNDRREMTETLQAFASLCMVVDDRLGAVRLLGRAHRLREELGGGAHMFPFQRIEYERQVADARLKLQDDAAFGRAWNEGRSMTLAEAVRYALET